MYGIEYMEVVAWGIRSATHRACKTPGTTIRDADRLGNPTGLVQGLALIINVCSRASFGRGIEFLERLALDKQFTDGFVFRRGFLPAFLLLAMHTALALIALIESALVFQSDHLEPLELSTSLEIPVSSSLRVLMSAATVASMSRSDILRRYPPFLYVSGQVDLVFLVI